MKRYMMLPVLACMVFLGALPAFADDIFADKDTVKVYAEMDKEAEVLKTLKGGDRVKLLEPEKDKLKDKDWAKIEIEVSSEKKEGYAWADDMALTMPPKYCEHDWTDWTITREETCTQGAEMERNCPTCGSQEKKETDPPGHDFGDWETTQQPTCVAEGIRARSCSRCGAQETESIPMTDHAFGDWAVTKEATCVEEGTRTRTCSICGLEENETIEKTAHTFGDWAVTKEATCVEEGTRARTCSVCGLEETETIEKTAHTFGDWTVTKEATCVEEGTQARTCGVCGLEETEMIGKTAHTFGDWTVTKEATCVEEGTRARVCSFCGLEETETIGKTAHTFGDWTVTKAATCVEEGTRSRKCSFCGLEETETIGKTAHTFGDWTVTKAATCTEEGTRARACSFCGHEETETISKIPHNFTDWKVEKQPTCTAEGKRARKCRTCGLEESETMAKVPHTYGKWKVIRKPTCTEDGEMNRTCKVCGQVEKEQVEKLGHDYEVKIITQATDHSAGVRAKVCKTCGKKENEESFDPEGTLRRGYTGEDVWELQQLLAEQNYLNAGGVDGIYGGGTEKAVMEFQYARKLYADGIAWPQTLRLLRHDYDDWTIITMPTREAPGERVRKCKDCGYEQHEIFELEPYFEYGRRGEDVRAAQQMITAAGYDAGAYDGIYGRKLDEAFTGLAEEKGFAFKAGEVLPVQIDELVNTWIEVIPEENWMGDGGMGSSVNLALTITPVMDSTDETMTVMSGEETAGSNVAAGTPAAADSNAGAEAAPAADSNANAEAAPAAETNAEIIVEPDSEEKADDIVWFNWSLTNMGDEECMFAAVLLQFGDEPDFKKDNFVMILDGETLKANCANSVSGSFMASRSWGEGNMNFTAVAVSEATGKTWLSNIETLKEQPEEIEIITENSAADAEENIQESTTENRTEGNS